MKDNCTGARFHNSIRFLREFGLAWFRLREIFTWNLESRFHSPYAHIFHAAAWLRSYVKYQHGFPNATGIFTSNVGQRGGITGKPPARPRMLNGRADAYGGHEQIVNRSLRETKVSIWLLPYIITSIYVPGWMLTYIWSVSCRYFFGNLNLNRDAIEIPYSRSPSFTGV